MKNYTEIKEERELKIGIKSLIAMAIVIKAIDFQSDTRTIDGNSDYHAEGAYQDGYDLCSVCDREFPGKELNYVNEFIYTFDICNRGNA